MTATLTRKTLLADVRVKDADQGIVELVFSTFNKVDKDNDVTLKGAFAGNPPVVLGAYNHESWKGGLPYGTGTIHETDTEAVAEVKFLLDTAHGRDAFITVKALSEVGLQEWSYSLEQVKSRRGEFQGRKVNFLESIFVKELCPVLRGAGTDTRTTDIKSEIDASATDDTGAEPPQSSKFSEHFDFALRGVKQLTEMAVERLTLRAAEGKSIDEQVEAHDALTAALAPLKAAIDDATQPPPISDVEREYLRFVASSKGSPIA